MKFVTLALLTIFTLTTAMAHNHEEKKPEDGHDKEHQHVKANPDHTHEDAHHKPHDHKAHHPDHEDKKEEPKKK